MKNHRTKELISDSILAFHPIDYRGIILRKYNQRLKRYARYFENESNIVIANSAKQNEAISRFNKTNKEIATVALGPLRSEASDLAMTWSNHEI